MNAGHIKGETGPKVEHAGLKLEPYEMSAWQAGAKLPGPQVQPLSLPFNSICQEAFKSTSHGKYLSVLRTDQ